MRKDNQSIPKGVYDLEAIRKYAKKLVAGETYLPEARNLAGAYLELEKEMESLRKGLEKIDKIFKDILP